MEWRYQGYEKMEEDIRRWGLDERGLRQMRKVSWVILEKIHGAHFCILTDGQAVAFGKRREILEEDEDFFGHKAIAVTLAKAAREVAHALLPKAPKATTIAIHGELFGGAYPHPAIPAREGVQAIQTGIWYAPDIHFCAFDIALDVGEGGGRSYLPYKEAMPRLQEAGFLTAQPLRIGKYEEIALWDLNFESRLPAVLGLPPLPEAQIAEGIVARSWEALSLQDSKGRPFRPIFKRKHPSFAEDARFHQAQAWESSPAYLRHTPPSERIIEAIQALATPQRLVSALSKVGRPRSPHDKKRRLLLEELQADLLHESQTLDPKAWKALSEAERASCLGWIEDACQDLLRKSGL